MSRPVTGRVFALASAAVVASLPALAGPAAPSIDFQHDIRPILSEKCFACHGPDPEPRKARLRLDLKEGPTSRQRGGYSVVVPGEPEESELYYRVTTDDAFDRMPPEETGEEITPEEAEKIRQWIASGAPWREHWSFVPPQRPALPEVEREKWVRNPIDRFVLARLEAEGLEPAGEADPRTLLRRVAFDITGLPPAPEAVEAFVSDPRPDAYERAVDRLLASPHYGEHMAHYWLDAARYGDTHGLHLDNLRIMWPYRDWVIDAYNANKPFDRFTIEQLAGDLLPDPTQDQRVATGFNRCNVTTSEGGAIDEEFYVRYAVDRVETTSTVWMGLTAGCAQCHSHKFDPITQKEFYQLFAFFNNVAEPAMDGNKPAVPPVAEVPFPGVPEERAEIARQIADLEAKREERARELSDAFAAWVAEAETKARESGPEPPSRGLQARLALDAGPEKVATAGDPQRRGRAEGEVAPVEGKFGRGLRFDGGHVSFDGLGDYEAGGAFGYGAWVRTPGDVTGAPFARMHTKNGHRGWDLYIAGRKVAMHLIHRWPAQAIKVTTEEDVLEPGRWHHVFVTYDGSRRASGVTLWVDGKRRKHEVNKDSLGDASVRNEVPLRLGSRHTGSAFTGGAVDEVRIYDRALDEKEVAALAGLDPIGEILRTPAPERTGQQVATLRDRFLSEHDERYRELGERLAELRAEDTKLAQKTATTLVMKEREKRKPAHVLFRGQYDQPREEVQPGVPAALPPLPEDAPRNRLGFARWLVDPAHPLTARVAVNRMWQQKFGRGIVQTTGDFGSQGKPPTHPGLLDWLAVEFRESGWDVKYMHRLIVNSATYRQSSRTTEDKLAADPANRLLSRGPRYRLDAEMLRDQALAASGLLVRRIGGPSVKPPQPDGLWYAVAYTSSNTARFKADTGSKIYRRGVYTFWKRTSPPPQMATFDAPSREACRVRRERTNTPLQALLLMNEQQYVECARVLAERALSRGLEDPAGIASWMFERVTLRPPGEADLKVLLGAYRDHLATYREDPEAAQALLQVGASEPDPELEPAELATWTMIGNLILNLDEVINKE